ncbi:uncharacterized protein LAJ45_11153 [Morchella importuna]|uniref:uncharacterized protein n=1 Tax=Morchella importuna TaxID=1174673 RepID=UPI001E8E80BC|nr:uncharacterized protein LAJ45_11153 [Morchella importuna]KAH8144816.1 hypothetical protein LAJ45_11153 [Morchella importuna]
MKTSTCSLLLTGLFSLGSSFASADNTSAALEAFAEGLGLSSSDIAGLAESYDAEGDNVDISCSLLSLLFPESTVLPGAEAVYTSKVGINWSVRAHLTPTCIFSPNATSAAATGVKIAAFLNTPFAIRSGGHTPDPGAASIERGVLFSLENLNEVTVDHENGVARIGPGNRWISVYEKCESEDVLVVGGRVAPVGVGGLVTGGGLSFLSGTEGFAADTVKNFQVVLASGEVVNANATSHSDLWWALKGGSNNFGLVTRIDLATIAKPSGLIYGGTLYFLPYQYPAIISAIKAFQEKGQIEDPKAAIISSFVRMPSQSAELLTLQVFHQDPEGTVPPSLQAFFDVGPFQNTASVRPLSSLANEIYAMESVPVARQAFRDLSVGVSEEMYQYAVDLFASTYTALDNVPGFLGSFTYQPISTAMVDVANATGGRAMGVPRVPHVWFCLNAMWAEEADDELVLGTGKAFMEKLAEKSRELGVAEGFFYLNDAAADQSVMESYGEEVVERLRGVSAVYDEGKVFQKLVKGGFKLW